MTVGRLEKHAFLHGLLTEIVLYSGTPWTYFRFSKRSPVVTFGGQRIVGEVRPELQRLLVG